MSDVGQDIVRGLREFAERLESNKPQTFTFMHRVETPDGPMHFAETVELTPFCPDCGDDIDDCRCCWTDA